MTKTTHAIDGQDEEELDQPTHPDQNEVTLTGRLAADPDVRQFPSGVSLARILVTTRFTTDRPRIDVVPVTVWEPTEAVMEAQKGSSIVVEGSVQRRFWTDANGRNSRLEVVASSVAFDEQGLSD